MVRSTWSSWCRRSSFGTEEAIRKFAFPKRFARLKRSASEGYLSGDDAEVFRSTYRLQRSLEARIRLMNASGRHELPSDAKELRKLAHLLGDTDPLALEQKRSRR